MAHVMLRFKDLEHLLKKQFPGMELVKWTSEGCLLDVDFHALNAQISTWKDITLYTFEEISPLQVVRCTIRMQQIGEKLDYQLIVE